MMNDTIPPLVRSCCADLFAAYEVPLEPVDTLTDRPEVCAVLGTTGDGNDWITELVNQLVGRIKNALLRHDIEIIISTPVRLRGDRLAPLAGGEVFRSPAGEVCVWFDFEPSEGVTWREATDDSAAASEGDLLLF